MRSWGRRRRPVCAAALDAPFIRSYCGGWLGWRPAAVTDNQDAQFTASDKSSGTCYMDRLLTLLRDCRTSAPVLLQFCHCERWKVHSGRMSKIYCMAADLRLFDETGTLEQVELTGLEPVTPTLPVGTKWFPGLRKYGTRSCGGSIQCGSARFGAVQTHSLLQICSTMSGVNASRAAAALGVSVSMVSVSSRPMWCASRTGVRRSI